MPSDNPEDDVKFLYDLRQRRAKVIGDQIDLISYLSRTQMYYEYYKAIDFLYTIAKHTFKADDKKYKELLTNINDTSKKHQSTWTGNNKTPEGVEKIERALKNLLEFVMEQIEKSGLFGTATRSEYEGI